MIPVIQSFLILTVVLAFRAQGKLNDFSRKPVLGFNTYNDIACSPNETYVEQRLDQLINLGFLDAGYKLFHLDCGWAGFNRTADGSLTWDPERFPNGIQPLSDKAIGMGFQWGMYTDTGYYMCDTAGFDDVQRPASRDHEREDSAMFASWNASYVKNADTANVSYIDNCWLSTDSQGNHNPRTDYVERYKRFSDAFDEFGIPGLAVCQWAVPYVTPEGTYEGPSEWTAPLATSYRVADDVYHSWDTVLRVWNEALHVNYYGRNGPGNFVDMDILEVGQEGLTVAEQQSHFAIWVTFKSTLLASTDLGNPTQDTLDILLNHDLLDIHQDDLAQPAQLVQRFTDNYDIYAGPLSNGDKVVLLVDQSNSHNKIGLDFSQVGVATSTVKNLWTGEVMESVDSYWAQVDGHGSIPLRLSNIVAASLEEPELTWYEAESGTFDGGARPLDCDACSNGSRAAFLCSDGASFALSNIHANAAEVDVRFDYINGQFSVDNDSHNVRGAAISVNGGPLQNVEFPFSGYQDNQNVWKNYLVRLSGFNTGDNNSITISTRTSLTNCGPDIDRIGVPL